ncbi:hypothetical protein PTTG_31072, partial [Puccinia triticina 1-1 BBBD Race 1]
MASSIATKEELACLLTLQGDTNYALWFLRMRTFMKNKDLWGAINVEPGANPARTLKKQLNDAAAVISMKICDRLYPSLVTKENKDNGFLLWRKITTQYSRYTAHRFTRCTTAWDNLWFNGHMLDFLDGLDRCLTNFAAIGEARNSRDICGHIVAKL